MAQPWGIGIWTVEAGRERHFVERWSELARWTSDNFRGSGARLLRDRDDRTRFVSMFAWEDEDAVEEWLADPGLAGRREALQETLSEGDRWTYDLVVEVD
jgi:heme-degrading monooxygenase HmoA